MLRVKFVDFWEESNLYKEITLELLRKNIGDVVESDTPDFLFYSVFGYEHLKYDCVRIFLTGENIQPDFNICDYAIGFSYMIYEDRYMRAPLYLFYREDYEKACSKHLIDEQSLKQKHKFCNFVYSNGKATIERMQMYEMLSKYKPVDSGGRYLNNIGGPVTDKYEFQKQYRYSIAFENYSMNGYTTEKILQAFSACTIPIYWGDPLIGEVFNEDAFINCHKYSSFEQVVEEVKRIDQNPELFEKYIRTPIWKDEIEKVPSLTEFETFITAICSQKPEKAIRRNNGRIGLKYQNEHRKMTELLLMDKMKAEKYKKSLFIRIMNKIRK